MYEQTARRDKATDDDDRDLEQIGPGKQTRTDGLPSHVVQAAGAALGHDFSMVKVHQDGEADRLGTRAFARGDDLHFAAGVYQPDTASGRALIGHELTHVAQQRDGRVPTTGAVGGVAVNTDPSLEAEADAGGSRVVQGFDLEGFLGFGGPAKTVAAPIVQGSNLPANDTTKSDASSSGAPHAAGTTATGNDKPLTLADVMGPDYESDRDEDESAVLDSFDEVSPLLGQISAKDAGEAARIDADFDAVNVLIREIATDEAAVMSSAKRDSKGGVTCDTGALMRLMHARDRLDKYGELFLAEADLWNLVLGLPAAEFVASVVAGWIKLLKNFQARIKVAYESYAKIDALLTKYQKELYETGKELQIDALCDVTDVLLFFSPFGGLARVGVKWAEVVAAGFASKAVDHGEWTLINGYKILLGDADCSREVVEHFVHDLTSEDFAALAPFFPLLIDGLSTAGNSSKVAIDKKMIAEITAAARDWQTKWGPMVQLVPEVVACLHAAMPYLFNLKAALQGAGPRMFALQNQVDALRDQAAH